MIRNPYQMLSCVESRTECILCGAETEPFLNRCARAGIPILSAERLEPYSLRLQLRTADFSRAEQIARHTQCELEIIRQTGVSDLGKRTRKRLFPVLLLSCFLFALAISKCFVWDISVTGNEMVSDARILNALSDCGVSPGCFWPKLTSDNLRSMLLVKLPELAWATVNIRGSRADVIVRERVAKPEIWNDRIPTDLVARTAGYVTEIRALDGTACVRKGNGVLPGEVLIEGRRLSAFAGEKELHARGSVKAQTYMELTAKLPSAAKIRAEEGKKRRLWALEIGGKRLIFYTESSICGENCDKIEKTWEWKRDGLYVLPVRLIRTELVPYAVSTVPRDALFAQHTMEQLLERELSAYLQPEGEAETVHFAFCGEDRTVSVCLRAACTEQIAVEQKRLQEETP